MSGKGKGVASQGCDEDVPVNLKEMIAGELYEIAFFIDGHAAGRHMSHFYLRCSPNPSKFAGGPDDWEHWPVSVVNEKEAAIPLIPERVYGSGECHSIPIKKWVVCHFRARRNGVGMISETHKKLENWYLHRWNTNQQHYDFELSIVIDKVPANKIKHIYASFRVHLAWKKADKTPQVSVVEVPKHIPLPSNAKLNDWTRVGSPVPASHSHSNNPLLNNGALKVEPVAINGDYNQGASQQPTINGFYDQWTARQNEQKIKFEQEQLQALEQSPQYQFHQYQIQRIQAELQYPQPAYVANDLSQQNYQSPVMIVSVPEADADDFTLTPPQVNYYSDLDMDLSWYPGDMTHYGIDFQSAAIDFPIPELYSDLLPDSMDMDTKQQEMFEMDTELTEANTLYIWPMGGFDGISDRDIVNYACSVIERQAPHSHTPKQRIVVCIPDITGHGDVLVKTLRALLKRFGIRDCVSLWNIVLNDSTVDAIPSSEDSAIAEVEKVEVRSRALINSILSVAMLAKKNPQHRYILQLSWSCNQTVKAFERAITLAQAHGVLIITAAGNRGIDLSLHPEYPSSANMRNVLTVGSLNHDRRPATNSNYRSILVDTFPFVWAPGTIQFEKSDNSIQATSIAAAFLSVQASYKWLQLLSDSPTSNWKELLKLLVRDNMNTYIWTQYLKPIPSLTEVLPPGPAVIWVDTGNPLSFLSTFATYCDRNGLVSVSIYRFVHSGPLFQFLAHRRKELNQKSNQNALRFVSNRFRDRDGGASAGKDLYEGLRKDPDFKKSPFLLFCGRLDDVSLSTDLEQRLWVSNDAGFAVEFVAMQQLPNVPDHNWKLLRGPMILTGVVRGLNFAQLLTSGSGLSSNPPTTSAMPLTTPAPVLPANVHPSSSISALTSAVSSLSTGGSTHSFYIKVSFNDDVKESVSTTAVEGVTDVYEWNFFHKKQLIPTLVLASGPSTTASPSSSSIQVSSTSTSLPSTSSPVATVVTFELYCRKKRNILPSVIFGDAKDLLLGSANVDIRALTDQQLTQMWLPLSSASATPANSTVPMQGLPKLLVKILKLSPGRVTTQPEFEAVDPLPEGVVSMTTEL